jgi:hypothetical protein
MIQTRVKDEWLYDVSWTWSDSLGANDRAGTREKSQSLTLTMTHNPTHVSLIRSISVAQRRRHKISQLRSQFWLELFHDLQRRLLNQQNVL